MYLRCVSRQGTTTPKNLQLVCISMWSIVYGMNFSTLFIQIHLVETKKCIFLAAPTVCNPFNCCADVWTYIDFGIRRIWTLITWVISAVGKVFICSSDSSECALSESARIFYLNMKTDTADPTEWYNVSEICLPTRNNDSQELTTGVYLNVINSLWHEFFNSIHPNISSGDKKMYISCRPNCV